MTDRQYRGELVIRCSSSGRSRLAPFERLTTGRCTANSALLKWCVMPVRELKRGARGVIERDFAFRGNKAANRLPNFHDHGPMPRCRRDNPDGTGTRTDPMI
jgi:hypothetical protein